MGRRGEHLHAPPSALWGELEGTPRVVPEDEHYGGSSLHLEQNGGKLG